MKVRLFVTGSATLLAAWLVATFLNEVPAETYNQSGPGSVPLSAKAGKPASKEKPVVIVADEGIVPVSNLE